MTPTAFYPPDLEAWWLAVAGRRLRLRDPKTIAQRLAETAGRLSDAFTVGRQANFSDCYADPLTVAAYGNYFFPQTYVRARLAVGELIARCGWSPPAGRPLRVTDLGGGAGAALIAAVDLIAEQFSQTQFDAAVIDRSAVALKLYRHLTRDRRKRHLFKSAAVSADLAAPAAWPDLAPRDLVIASFSLGEAFYGKPAAAVLDWLAAMREKLTASGLLIILEPALKETAERLERLRDLIVSAGGTSRWHLWAPCLHEKPCPLLAGKKHWCHEVRHWPVPPTVNRINDRLRRSVWDLKYSFLALGTAPPPAAPGAADGDPRRVRLLTPAVSGHGRLLLSGCNAAGEHADYDLLKRRLDPLTAKQFARLQRGEVVTFSAIEQLGGSCQYRCVGLTPIC
ncbi:MAG: small ribosomal subunit Rsm22 family protein [Verrucomicrobiales bacterium]|jgi:ribosomal protein RSM22 (predicted rRNA methylase)|nr:small ribosomal subunit Rsm22 family protein [Verrucomicrobiales bacterium]